MIKILLGTICILPLLGWALFRSQNNRRYLKLYAIASIIFPAGFLYWMNTNGGFQVFRESPSYVKNEKKVERWQLAQRLAEDGNLINNDSNQVKSVLGNPDKRMDTIGQWYYDMGSEVNGMGWRLHALLITYSNGKVVDVKHSKFDD